jgi:formamidopyrimidine-DNA glycosylase
MPELPEVETVIRYLQPYLASKTILKLLHHNDYSNVFSSHSPKEISRSVQGQTIQKIWRRGKYIVFTLECGYLYFHLRMTGQLVTTIENQNHKYITAELFFSDKTSLYFKDYRKFGRIGYTQSLSCINQLVGVEPLGSWFTMPRFQKELKKRKWQIKPLLLDQSFICGLGNIYVDECLWRSCIHPQTTSNKLQSKNVEMLYQSIVTILREAISLNGTTIINFQYGENNVGNFKQFLKVYARERLPCFRCKNKIKKVFIGQRGTYFCNICQR